MIERDIKTKIVIEIEIDDEVKRIYVRKIVFKN